jgi:hypothetical protein
MKTEIKDLSKHFEGSNIDLEITQWKQDGKEYYLTFLPLITNNLPQYAMQRNSNEITKIEFYLIEENNLIYFIDLINGKKFILDLKDLNQSIFQLIGQDSIAVFRKVQFLSL